MPRRVLIRSPAEFSWQATFEPFKLETPRSRSRSWLDFGHPTDESAITKVVREWLAEDRQARVATHLSGLHVPAKSFARESILKAGYFDLALSIVMGVGISIDRRHQLAIAERIVASRGEHIGGHDALEVLLPSDFSWADVPGLRRQPAIREYRAVVRDVEAAAMDAATSSVDLRRRIQAEYAGALATASAKGLPVAGRVTIAAVGFAVGIAADTAAPLVGGATASTATFAAGEIASRLMRPRWLSVDRRINGRRNGV